MAIVRTSEAAERRRFEETIALLLQTGWTVATELRPFLPDAAARIEAALTTRDPQLGRTLFRMVVVEGTRATSRPRSRSGGG